MLDAWIARMAAAKVLMADERALRAELSGWLELLDLVIAGEKWAEDELSRLVSFRARNLGAEGRPASACLLQIMLLGDVLAEAQPEARAASKRLIEEMLQLVADAHEAGVTQRLAAKHRARLATVAPVFRLGERTVVGFVIGPMIGELLDALFGRLLREASRTDATVMVVDCFGGDDEGEVFYRTIAGVQKTPPGDRMHIVVSSVKSNEVARRGLERAGADMLRVRLADDVHEALAQAAIITP
jgi:hypothetical protein